MHNEMGYLERSVKNHGARDKWEQTALEPARPRVDLAVLGVSTTGVALRNLHYVVAAAEQRSFRRAAVELGVGESTVSRAIRRIEEEIGVGLFIRHSAGAILTDAGRDFLGHARAALERVEHAIERAGVAGRGENGTIRIGTPTSLPSQFLLDLLHQFQAKHESG